jgi:hypothetical protein
MPRTEPVSAASIVGVARAVLGDARSNTLWDGKPPIPVEQIAEALLDLRLEWSALTTRGDDRVVLAGLWVSKRCVVFNETVRWMFDETPGLFRYTLAHEIGHLKLHVTGADATEPKVICGADQAWQQERQAESFAAVFLMPDDLVHQAVAGRSTGKWPVTYQLRERFDVSVSAMRRRLTELGYPVPTDTPRMIRLKV